jgi:hypothetical protein
MKKVEEKEIALGRKNRELEERKRQIEEELKKLGSLQTLSGYRLFNQAK